MEESYTIGENRWVKTKYGWVLADNLKPDSTSGMTPSPTRSESEVRKNGKLSDKPPRMSLWGKIKSLFVRRKKTVASPVSGIAYEWKAMEAATQQSYVKIVRAQEEEE